ncbi:MAG TPA: CAP domain-containing protein [Planctomycetota bacterium]|nr:CAP domain-containing protein [Planctomycetota bacterium]
MRVHLGILFCLLSTFAAFAADVYQAADREPSAEEVLILEYMNRFRADPVAEADRLAPGGEKIAAARMSVPGNIDWEMFKKEVKALKSAPPLVMNLNLLDAARKHSHYMILNELTHVEDPSKPGFTAKDPGERCKLAGYPPGMYGENAFRDAGSVMYSHAGFIIDWGEGPGGMQPTRGHRANMINREFREIGAGALPHNNRLSVTHNFGARNVPRLAGGVVYFDKNGNNFYDIGEGVGGVTITAADGSTTSTWKSGGFALDLKGTAATTLTAEFQGQKYTKTFEAGKDNIKFDWIVPEKVALDRADQLLAAVDKVKDTSTPAYFRAVVALHLGVRGLSLSSDRQKRIDDLTKTIGPELDTRQKNVLEAMENMDPQKFQKVLGESRKPYNGTVAETWFKEAEVTANMKLGVANFQKQAAVAKPSPQDRKTLASQLEAMEKQLTTPQFKQEVAALISKVKTSPESLKR